MKKIILSQGSLELQLWNYNLHFLNLNSYKISFLYFEGKQQILGSVQTAIFRGSEKAPVQKTEKIKEKGQVRS